MQVEKSFELAEKGAHLCFSGKPNEALPFLQEAVKLNPLNTDALFSLGGCLVDLHRYEDALEKYLTIIEINPYDIMAKTTAIIVESKYHCKNTKLDNFLSAKECNEFGVLEYQNSSDDEDLEKALFFFNKAIKLDPKVPEFYNNRGSAHMYLSNFGNAMRDYNTALDLRPDYRSVRINIEKCHSLRAEHSNR